MGKSLAEVDCHRNKQNNWNGLVPFSTEALKQRTGKDQIKWRTGWWRGTSGLE